MEKIYPGQTSAPGKKIFPGRKKYCVYMGRVHRLTGKNWTRRSLCETSKKTQRFYESCDGQKLMILIASRPKFLLKIHFEVVYFLRLCFIT